MSRKGRSPNYPQLSLEEAIERVAKIHKAERTHKVVKEAVAKDLGYGGLNGASTAIIGTLKSYGLLQEDKEGVRVTEDAVTILRAPEGNPEKVEALERVAFAPRVFAELRESYGAEPSELPSETTLQYRLERKGFLEKAASEVIRTYRDNLELIPERKAEYNDIDAHEEVQKGAESPVAQPATNKQAPPHDVTEIGGKVEHNPDQPDGLVLQFKVSETSEARIELTGDVARDSIENLIALLNVQKLAFPEKEGPTTKRPAEQRTGEQPVEQSTIEMSKTE